MPGWQGEEPVCKAVTPGRSVHFGAAAQARLAGRPELLKRGQQLLPTAETNGGDG